MTILLIVLAVLAVWMVAAVLLALVMGRAMQLADADHRRRVATRPTAVRTTSSRRLRAYTAS